MELMKLSKFKLRLQSLATELGDLRERENSAKEQCRILIQKHKQTEEEYGRKLQELQAELDSSNELCQKFERKVSYLQNDNVLLENRQKELQGTIQDLLQSRENFVNAYKESTCEMKRSIEVRDRKLSVLNGKLNSYLSLFDSIEKEALSIKKVMDNVQLLVSEKEELVAGLRSKMDKVTAFEKVFSEKIRNLEKKLKIDEDKLRKKDEIISELEMQLEAAKLRDNGQIQVEDKTLSAKDAVIQNLMSEREALLNEVENLAKILQKVKEIVKNLEGEDKMAFNRALKCQENCDLVGPNDDNRIEVVVQNSGEASPDEVFRVGAAENEASPACQEQYSVDTTLLQTNHLGSCESESPSSALQSTVNGPSISVNNGKVNCAATIQHLDSECSTNQAETSEVPEEKLHDVNITN